MRYKEKYQRERNANVPKTAAADPGSLSDEQLFQYIDDIIISEHLFTDPNFGRQTIMERFQLSKDRVGTVFSKGGNHAKMSNYIQLLRLEYAAQLLVENPDKSIVQIASDSGFKGSSYFCRCFRDHFGMTPSDYRQFTV